MNVSFPVRIFSGRGNVRFTRTIWMKRVASKLASFSPTTPSSAASWRSVSAGYTTPPNCAGRWNRITGSSLARMMAR